MNSPITPKILDLRPLKKYITQEKQLTNHKFLCAAKISKADFPEEFFWRSDVEFSLTADSPKNARKKVLESINAILGQPIKAQ